MKTKKELVVKLLKKNSDGLTIIEIARKLKFSRNTIAIVLAELKGAEQIRIKPEGKDKINYWKRGNLKGINIKLNLNFF